MTDSQPPRSVPAAANAAATEAWRTHVGSKIVRFQDLAHCGEEIWIEHEGQLYRLRKTRQGKLILTK
ncbi:hemin uptake protein HemP [Roseimaritima sediminicola]|uniref:hemin uptake protein HemP n=1 Tax=Roseimaritima sediminicola TaxID=2662066 RepID=UPI0012984338|nr:hemin uptake protein HemP [Roseimaritima sediminicola]